MPVSDHLIKCVEGKKYDVVKNNKYFEWVNDFENSINNLTAEVFDVIGVKTEAAVNIGVDILDKQQTFLKDLVANYSKKLVSSSLANDEARKFANDWAEGVEYQTAQKYHLMGGASAEKLRWSFESAISYFIICSTTLADMVDSSEFKIDVSNFAKEGIQNLIDSLQEFKDGVAALKN
ncbi:uncharacterized protein LOC126842561 [Adelges cooleyi]|uniref:uncharacterized protein LOC126842561 n=1 Tax=Adelges cooleyi TaxID=133065 RepID=UPI00217F7E35|nr:uncharacterized protein LOC126842561 [Adelges cooleyi]